MSKLVENLNKIFTGEKARKGITKNFHKPPQILQTQNYT